MAEEKKGFFKRLVSGLTKSAVFEGCKQSFGYKRTGLKKCTKQD